jgi:hypothetical protein
VTICRRETTDHLLAQWQRAQDSLTVAQCIGLALRHRRSTLRVGQREYAQSCGWSKSHQARLESSPENLKLADVLAALDGTGYHLELHHDGDGRAVAPVDWAASELVARFRDGRRFPAAVNAVRSGSARSWFYTRHPDDVTTPSWTWFRDH